MARDFWMLDGRVEMLIAHEMLAVARSLENAFNRHDIAAYMDHYSPEVVLRFNGAEARGIEAFADGLRQFLVAFPDAAVHFHRCFTEGGRLGIEMTVTGTHLGPYPVSPSRTIPGGGRKIDVPELLLITFDDAGKIAAESRHYDKLLLLEQIGAAALLTHTRDDLVALQDRLFDAVNRHDADGEVACYSEDVVCRMVGEPAVLGREGARAAARFIFTVFPDIRVTHEHVLVQDDTIVTAWTAHATHKSAIGPIPASGKQLSWCGVKVCQIGGDGLFHSVREYDSREDVLRQIGITDFAAMR